MCSTAPRFTAWCEDHLDGRENRRLLIWSLLYLETWARIFLDGDHPEPAPIREAAARML